MTRLELPRKDTSTVLGFAKYKVYIGARSARAATVALLVTVLPSLLLAAPTIRSVKPSSVTVGDATLTVNGKGYEAGSVVYFGLAGAEAAVTTEFNSSRKLLASVVVSDALIPTGASLYVKNSDDTQSSAVAIPVSEADDGGGGGGKGGGKGLSRSDAMRFLYQATWGSTEESIDHVMAIGRDAFIEEQFNAIPSDFPEPDPTYTVTTFRPAQDRFYYNAVHSDDQLRQRMAFFLSQIWVVSSNTVGKTQQMVPYLRILHNNAFGNYRDILTEVTLSPTMGRYLDMVNNKKESNGVKPNENYPRELLQLFTDGPILLNNDGSQVLDAAGDSVPSYDEAVVVDLARVFTGWTYPTKPGAEPKCTNSAYDFGPMEANCEDRHDIGAKTLMNGYVIPAGGTARQDLDLALDHIYAHQNMGPFLALRMIHHFVTSNPSAAYVNRVAKVFNSSKKVRGDLKAVIKAVLTDREALSSEHHHTHLREPVLFANALLRAFDATLSEPNPLRSRVTAMGQEVFRPPSVFNYFHLAHGTFHGTDGSEDDGPEFAIHTFSTAIDRADFVYRLARNILGTGATLNLGPYLALADTPDALTDAVINTLLSAPLSSTERQSIITAVSDVSAGNPARRVEYAIYLTALARAQVQH